MSATPKLTSDAPQNAARARNSPSGWENAIRAHGKRPYGTREREVQQLQHHEAEPGPDAETGAEELVEPAEQRQQIRDAEEETVIETGTRRAAVQRHRKQRKTQRRQPPQGSRREAT